MVESLLFLFRNIKMKLTKTFFKLKDTVELREHHWVPRKAFLDNGPKTINQIRQDAVKVRFFSIKWVLKLQFHKDLLKK